MPRGRCALLKTLAELRSMSDEQLVAHYDRLAVRTVDMPALYMDELNRRAQERQAEAIVTYARQVAIMTLIIMIATILNIAVALLALC